MLKSSVRGYLLSLSCLVFIGTLPAQSEPAAFDRYLRSGQKAYDAGQFRVAGTSFIKALPLIESANQPALLALTLTKIARSLSSQGKYAEANSYLQRALATYKGLGGVSPDFATAYNEISSASRSANLDSLGEPSSRALKANSAEVVLMKGPGATRVQITVPARFESNLASDKIDQLALEKLVTFDINKDAGGVTTVSNIKGFKIHSVEKGMWVNLLNLVIRQPDGAGKYDAEITAGKAGVEKVVPSKLPEKVVAPISGILTEIAAMSTVPALPLPVVAALNSPTGETSSSTPATSTASVTTTTTTAPPEAQPATALPTTTVEATPAPTPVAQPTPAPTPVAQPSPAATPSATVPITEPGPVAIPVPVPVATPASNPQPAPTPTATKSHKHHSHDADDDDDDDDKKMDKDKDKDDDKDDDKHHDKDD